MENPEFVWELNYLKTGISENIICTHLTFETQISGSKCEIMKPMLSPIIQDMPYWQVHMCNAFCRRVLQCILASGWFLPPFSHKTQVIKSQKHVSLGKSDQTMAQMWNHSINRLTSIYTYVCHSLDYDKYSTVIISPLHNPEVYIFSAFMFLYVWSYQASWSCC